MKLVVKAYNDFVIVERELRLYSCGFSGDLELCADGTITRCFYKFKNKPSREQAEKLVAEISEQVFQSLNEENRFMCFDLTHSAKYHYQDLSLEAT